MSDPIDRQAALDALHGYFDGMLETDTWSPCDVYGLIEILPAAERKKGKWIQNDNGTYSCSLCHSWIPEEQHYYARYCLFCGADMREVTE